VVDLNEDATNEEIVQHGLHVLEDWICELQGNHIIHTFNRACIVISSFTNYSVSHIKKLDNGTDPMSVKASRNIARAYKKYKTPKRTRHRIHIEFETLADKEMALALSNAERVRRLLR